MNSLEESIKIIVSKLGDRVKSVQVKITTRNTSHYLLLDHVCVCPDEMANEILAVEADIENKGQG